MGRQCFPALGETQSSKEADGNSNRKVGCKASKRLVPIKETKRRQAEDTV